MLKIADYLRTDHTEIYISPKQALEVIPKLPSIYDEPFSDSSQIPTFLISQLAKQHVKFLYLVMEVMSCFAVITDI